MLYVGRTGLSLRVFLAARSAPHRSFHECAFLCTKHRMLTSGCFAYSGLSIQRSWRVCASVCKRCEVSGISTSWPRHGPRHMRGGACRPHICRSAWHIYSEQDTMGGALGSWPACCTWALVAAVPYFCKGRARVSLEAAAPADPVPVAEGAVFPFCCSAFWSFCSPGWLPFHTAPLTVWHRSAAHRRVSGNPQRGAPVSGLLLRWAPVKCSV